MIFLAALFAAATSLCPVSPAHAQESVRRWGASLSLNVPHPLFLEAHHVFNPEWSAGLGLGGLSLNLPQEQNRELTIGIGAIDIRGRWHPWDGAFFLGGILGAQTMSGKYTLPIPVSGVGNIVTTTIARVRTSYFTPHFGWIWKAPTGFMIGFEFGAQFPLNSQTEIDISTADPLTTAALTALEATPEYQDAVSKVRDAGDTLGQTPLPYVTVIRVGWMF